MSIEQQNRKTGARAVAGIDEAGRGPLAGPVVAAAVLLPVDFQHERLTDSKKLSARQRDLIYEELVSLEGVTWAFEAIDSTEIDRINILRATHLAMERAASALDPAPDHVIIDGREVPGFPIAQTAVVGGDGRSFSVAAASVIAKVERDRLMLAFDRAYPQYGFRSHKGYGTREHLERLNEHGPCPIHRYSFRPVSQLALSFDEEGC